MLNIWIYTQESKWYISPWQNQQNGGWYRRIDFLFRMKDFEIHQVVNIRRAEKNDKTWYRHGAKTVTILPWLSRRSEILVTMITGNSLLPVWHEAIA